MGPKLLELTALERFDGTLHFSNNVSTIISSRNYGETYCMRGVHAGREDN